MRILIEVVGLLLMLATLWLFMIIGSVVYAEDGDYGYSEDWYYEKFYEEPVADKYVRTEKQRDEQRVNAIENTRRDRPALDVYCVGREKDC